MKTIRNQLLVALCLLLQCINLQAGNQHLFDEYMKFDPDSAIYYARKARQAAQKGGLRVEAVNAMIDEARELTLQGNLLKAQTLFQEIGDIQSVLLPTYMY